MNDKGEKELKEIVFYCFKTALAELMEEDRKAYNKRISEAWEAEQEEDRKREAFFNDFYKKQETSHRGN